MNNFKLEQMLVARDVKPTSNRLLVLKAFVTAGQPLTLARLEEMLDYTIDKGCIFRVLELFARKDVIHVIEDGSRSFKYELCHGESEHTISDQHVHFFCENCKEIFCFENQRIPQVETPEGFSMRSINYMIKGLCPKCLNHSRNDS